MDDDTDYLATVLFAWFSRIYLILDRDQTRYLRKYPVTHQQYGVMATLLPANPLPFGELCRRTGLRGSSLTGMIDRLERKGFVARTGDTADRRKVLVRLTKKGEQVLRKLPTVDKKGVLRVALDSLAHQERLDLLRHVARFGEAMGIQDLDEAVRSLPRFRPSEP